MGRDMKISFFGGVILMFFCLSIYADKTTLENNMIDLPKPNLSPEITLKNALKNRRSMRAFSTKELSNQTLSNLLWSAFGVNRSDGKRTAPSAVNAQDVSIYLAMGKGVFKYKASQNKLDLVLKEDIRDKVGSQSFLNNAPVVLIYISDLSKFTKMSESDKIFYSAADTGLISQNVYLYCAGEGLATVVAGWAKRDVIAEILKLSSTEKVTLIQPVGYPK